MRNSATALYFLMMMAHVLRRTGALLSYCHKSTRALSTLLTSMEQDRDVTPELLHPSAMTNGTIPAPKSLSPSAISEFKNCPQSYLFQYLWGIRQPTSLVLAKGSMCHEALEKLFDLAPEERSLETLQNLFRVSWSKVRNNDTYRILFGSQEGKWDTEGERTWGKSGLALLENYYQLEDPTQICRPNPVQREIWVRSDLALDSSLGVTATTKPTPPDAPCFHVRGIIDRIDMYKSPDDGRTALRIVDYKTGKAPNLKYSPTMNEKIVTQAFYQLKIYALLLREKNVDKLKGLDLRMLRLLFLTSEDGPGQYLDMDMGATQDQRDVLLNEIHADVAEVWTNINALVTMQDPKAFVGCDRSFCYCHTCRPRFMPNTLWEPN